MKIEGVNRLSDDLFLDLNKKSKSKYEIRKENGYIRHYVTKANGETVMIKETKLPKSQENEQQHGDLLEQMTELAMKQLTKMLDREHVQQFAKTGLVGLKERQLEKYENSI